MRPELTLSTPCSQPAVSMWIHGGRSAPRRARSYVLEELGERIPAATAADAALIVSELVTNSVVHANASHSEAVTLELTTLNDRLHVTVTDSGSEVEPHLRPADPTTPGGFGLRLVEQMSCAWGVLRDAGGTTRVWCDLPLHPGVPD